MHQLMRSVPVGTHTTEYVANALEPLLNHVTRLMQRDEHSEDDRDLFLVVDHVIQELGGDCAVTDGLRRERIRYLENFRPE